MECRATAAKSTVAGSSSSAARKTFARGSQKAGKVRAAFARRAGASRTPCSAALHPRAAPSALPQLPAYTGLRSQQRDGQLEPTALRAGRVAAARGDAAPVAELQVRGMWQHCCCRCSGYRGAAWRPPCPRCCQPSRAVLSVHRAAHRAPRDAGCMGRRRSHRALQPHPPPPVPPAHACMHAAAPLPACLQHEERPALVPEVADAEHLLEELDACGVSGRSSQLGAWIGRRLAAW